VTVADHAAEAIIRAEDRARVSRHGIRGEEHGMQAGASPYTWVIDPIDGTRSFILGQMHWATLIAVNDGKEVVAGVAHQPYVGESFVATAGGGAEWRRGGERRRLRTRRCAAFPTPCRVHRPQDVPCSGRARRVRPRIEPCAAHALGRRLLRLLPARHGVDRHRDRGSLHAYDVQALMPIVTESAGSLRRGRAIRPRRAGTSSPAATEHLHPEVLSSSQPAHG
jgi:myo-inositol-1(or 4)-monophosphatase